jgi:hypothetical protein
MLVKSRNITPLRSRLLPTQLTHLSLLAFIVLLSLPAQTHAQSNGISVGQPKVYDNQSLTIMLDQLSTRLDQVQAIDQQSLVKALGQTQGSEQQDVSRGFTASVSPPAAGGTASASPALPELLASPAYKPDYGENSLDLLSDQVDLTYQIFNVRMLLERAVTDRLINGLPRRQAVVSFNIALDPPKNAMDAAAYVEITLTSKEGPISLVAAMPQEKTYNATSLSSSSNAFGGAAVAKIVSLNYNQRKRKQIFFLYRDSDTLALERPAPAGAVTFGWTFRPVLGRRSVSAGMRQMFAVVALPDTDLPGARASEATAPLSINVHAKTYWLHYDHSTASTVTTNYPGFLHWSAKPVPPANNEALDTTIPALPTEAIEGGLAPTVSNVRAFQTTSGNTELQITGTNFFTGTSIKIGDKTFSGPQDGLFLKSSQTMLLAANSDLLSGALSAVVNGRYGPAVPLYPGASEGILLAKAQLRPLGPGYSTLELIVGDARPEHDLTLDSIRTYPAPILTLNGARIPYRASLQDTTDTISPFPVRKYVIAIVRVPNSLLQPQDNRAGIVFPLLGDSWSAEDLIYDPDAVQVTRMTTGKTTTLLIARPGMEFSGHWKLVLDKTYPLTDAPPSTPPPTPEKRQPEKKKPTAPHAKTPPPPPVEFSRILPCQKLNDRSDPNRCSMIRVVADSKFLSDYQKFVLVSDDGSAQVIDLSLSPPKEETPNPTLKVSSVEPNVLGLNEVVTVTVTGEGMDAVKQISFEGKPLTFWKQAAKTKPPGSAPAEPSPDKKAASPTSQIEVLLNRDITSKEGHQTFLLQVDDKTIATALVTVAPSPTATTVPQPSAPKAKEKSP